MTGRTGVHEVDGPLVCPVCEREVDCTTGDICVDCFLRLERLSEESWVPGFDSPPGAGAFLLAREIVRNREAARMEGIL